MNNLRAIYVFLIFYSVALEGMEKFSSHSFQANSSSLFQESSAVPPLFFLALESLLPGLIKPENLTLKQPNLLQEKQQLIIEWIDYHIMNPVNKEIKTCLQDKDRERHLVEEGLNPNAKCTFNCLLHQTSPLKMKQFLGGLCYRLLACSGHLGGTYVLLNHYPCELCAIGWKHSCYNKLLRFLHTRQGLTKNKEVNHLLYCKDQFCKVIKLIEAGRSIDVINTLFYSGTFKLSEAQQETIDKWFPARYKWALKYENSQTNYGSFLKELQLQTTAIKLFNTLSSFAGSDKRVNKLRDAINNNNLFYMQALAMMGVKDITDYNFKDNEVRLLKTPSFSYLMASLVSNSHFPSKEDIYKLSKLFPEKEFMVHFLAKIVPDKYGRRLSDCFYALATVMIAPICEKEAKNYIEKIVDLGYLINDTVCVLKDNSKIFSTFPKIERPSLELCLFLINQVKKQTKDSSIILAISELLNLPLFDPEILRLIIEEKEQDDLEAVATFSPYNQKLIPCKKSSS